MTVEVVMMSGLVVDESAVVHGSKHASTGTDPIPLGTTSAAGILQLASTGVPSATKPVRALGDDVAALLTAAGYTLTPATGANSMDGIADGDTYARTLKTIADALNAETYDAPKCTAFGIGSVVVPLNGIDANNTTAIKALSTGFYRVVAGTNWPSIQWGALLVEQLENGSGTEYTKLTYTPYNAYGVVDVWVRFLASGSLTSWYQQWGSGNDGNGGQPPAPKPNTTTGTIGQVTYAVLDGADTKLPSGGQWAFIWVDFSNSRVYTGTSSGGGVIAAGQDVATDVFCWRIA